jgi:hypothetical protein
VAEERAALAAAEAALAAAIVRPVPRSVTLARD